MSPRAQGSQARQQSASNFVPMVGNFSVQYNFTSASIAVHILSDPGYLGHALREEPKWAADLTLATVFLGAMVGMLVMGRLGDMVGRARAMQVTLAFTVLGSLIPACAFGSSNTTYAVVCIGRLVLGIGVGGTYPLSAVSSAEGCEESLSRGKHVGQAFFLQQFGQLAPYLVAMLLLALFQPSTPAEWVPQLQFRLLFALGAVPALVVLVSSFNEQDSEEFTEAQVAQAQGSRRLRHAGLASTLLGTAGSWFFYDTAFYGTTIFAPTILERMCLTGSMEDGRCQQSLQQTSLQSAIITAMGIPGCYAAMMMIDRMGCKRLNAYGFLALAVSFAALALAWMLAPQQHLLHFVLFCVLTFLLSWGPNLGTYVLPVICFPAVIRSTCHGVSSAGGKVGAVAGALIFPPISTGPFGVTGVLWLQAVICLLGAVVSWAFLKHDWEYMASQAGSFTFNVEVAGPILARGS
ncbi:PHT1-6 [Symbiodinium sp. CCMP2592]|nr:PHT1-6 [Symbiodinium sp. CCMP2592]